MKFLFWTLMACSAFLMVRMYVLGLQERHKTMVTHWYLQTFANLTQRSMTTAASFHEKMSEHAVALARVRGDDDAFATELSKLATTLSQHKQSLLTINAEFNLHLPDSPVVVDRGQVLTTDQVRARMTTQQGHDNT